LLRELINKVKYLIT